MSYLVVNNRLTYQDIVETDVIAIRDDVTLISDADWKQLVIDAGGEDKLIADLGVEDMRDAEEA
jgi:predicted homoserine dehydrogenase-like protein